MERLNFYAETAINEQRTVRQMMAQELTSLSTVSFMDIADTSSTPASIAIGGTYSGSMEVEGDVDWIKVTLVAGQSYRVTLAGEGATPVSDTYLQIFAPGSTSRSSGTMVARNDDVAANSGDYSSALVFTATESGTYYIDAGSYNNAFSGNYLVSVDTSAAPENSTPWTLAQIAKQLTEGFWGGTQQSFNVGADGALTVNLTALDATYQAYAREALALWSDATGLIFTEITGSAEVDFRQDLSGAWSRSDTSGTTIFSSTINIQAGWAGPDYTRQTFTHEIGHALGLGHAGNYNGSATYGIDNLYANDSWQATVMSYFDQNDNSYVNADFAFLKTIMLADIIAIRTLYGSTGTTRTGDTVYGFGTNAGSAFSSSVLDSTGTPYALTIIDDGGNDTINLSGSSATNRIDLNALAVSNTGGLIGNLFIAPNTVIENAIGGSGSDVLIGNGVANMLTGGGGADSLDGGDGNDTLVGGAGADTLVGGAGNDSFTVASGTDTITDLGGGDLFTVASGAKVNATVTAAWTASSGTTNSGTATLTTDGLAVSLAAVTGGSAGFNVTNAGAATSLTGSKFADTLTGGTGDDTLIGGGGADSMVGGDGNDLFIVAVAADLSKGEVIAGGNGSDELRFAATVASTLTLTAGVAVERVAIGMGTAAAAVATATTALNVTATALSTGVTLIGNAGVNRLTGGSGADNLDGGNGNDVLLGGAGDDTLVGGAGDDSFTVALGTDTITDLGGSDVFTVASGAAVNATVTAAWTATTGTTNAGTATLNTDGLAVNLAAVRSGSVGYSVSNAGAATTLTGSRFADTLNGGTGDDTLIGGGGADTIVGGDGNDLFIVAVAADLTTGEVINGGKGSDDLRFTATVASTLTLTSDVSVERVTIGTGTAAEAIATATTGLNVNAAGLNTGVTLIGNAGVNRLTGGSGADSLDGGVGNDVLGGGAGDDLLVGGAGNDNLTGGLGADVFLFNFTPNGSSNKDSITDFNVIDDLIWLAKSVMSGLGSETGTLSADAFWSGNGVRASHDETDRVIYNNTSGALYYDADGTGASAAVQIAQLTAGTLLTAWNVFVV